MFTSKPASPSLEFDEMARAFDRGALAALLDRNPDTISRWSRERVPHTAEAVVDRFWWVMHVACSQRQWTPERTKYFLLTIEPGIGRPPAELIRESYETTQSVVALIHQAAPEGDAATSLRTTVEERVVRPESPFAALLADEPAPEQVLTQAYGTPSLIGRARPIGGAQDDLDPIRVRYTTAASHAIPLPPAGTGD